SSPRSTRPGAPEGRDTASTRRPCSPPTTRPSARRAPGTRRCRRIQARWTPCSVPGPSAPGRSPPPGSNESAGPGGATGDPPRTGLVGTGRTVPTHSQTPAEPEDVAPPGVAAVHPDLRVALPAFEGPLDLLLHLIREHKLDVFDIPIALIAEKYNQSLAEM